LPLHLNRLLFQAESESGRLPRLSPAAEEILHRYLEALNSEARLNAAGEAFHEQRITQLLVNRCAIDRWLEAHPEILEEPIMPPVVVVGLPRTGTTLLHRTLATDDKVLAPLWYEVRQPSPLAANFADHDERVSIAEREVADILAASPELAAIHPMDATAPDEEIMLLEHAFMSTVPECYAQVPAFGEWLYRQDQSEGYAYLRTQLQFLQWQKRARGEFGKRWLLKTPHHLHYPDMLARTFPGARIIQTHRHPVEVIPSYGSMMCALASPFTDHLEATMTFREQPTHGVQYLDLQFADTLQKLDTTIAAVYRFTGDTLSPAARAEMARWRELNTRESRPEHHYTLSDYGLSEDGINVQFARYIARHL
jgi:hypothetical protein